MSENKVPHHLAIIPDGNRRWAQANNLPSIEGHRAGAKRLLDLARVIRGRGVHTLTVWGFSTENWTREASEVTYLMDLVMQTLKEHEKDAHEEQIRFYHLGRKDRIPTELAEEINRLERETLHYSKYILNLCFDYGGRDEIARAINKILQKEPKITTITKEEFAEYLDTAGQPHPNVDLLIRTSGEQRTSGLLPFQTDYAEFYFEQAPLPDFSDELLNKALDAYANRDRRFGGNSKK
jgi:undecaprenyl diphosphate synthase